jgi:hypothetical protein
MTKADYSNENIIKNNWPEWQEITPGRWLREWEMELERHANDGEATFALGQRPIYVTVVPGPAPTQLAVRVVTEAEPLSDEIFFYAMYEMFREIEHRFGKLKTMQGQPCDLWRPFRAEH